MGESESAKSDNAVSESDLNQKSTETIERQVEDNKRILYHQL